MVAAPCQTPSGLRPNAPSLRATRENTKSPIINALQDLLFGREAVSGIILAACTQEMPMDDREWKAGEP
jgi:hypothetical protein